MGDVKEENIEINVKTDKVCYLCGRSEEDLAKFHDAIIKEYVDKIEQMREATKNKVDKLVKEKEKILKVIEKLKNNEHSRFKMKTIFSDYESFKEMVPEIEGIVRLYNAIKEIPKPPEDYTINYELEKYHCNPNKECREYLHEIREIAWQLDEAFSNFFKGRYADNIDVGENLLSHYQKIEKFLSKIKEVLEQQYDCRDYWLELLIYKTKKDRDKIKDFINLKQLCTNRELLSEDSEDECTLLEVLGMLREKVERDTDNEITMLKIEESRLIYEKEKIIKSDLWKPKLNAYTIELYDLHPEIYEYGHRLYESNFEIFKEDFEEYNKEYKEGRHPLIIKKCNMTRPKITIYVCDICASLLRKGSEAGFQAR